MGSIEGRTALIVDEFTISAGTLVDAARVLVERRASSVYAAVSHGLLTESAMGLLEASPLERLFITDSVETQPDAM
jgi:ribose-phosphate pyrophosphokinase